MRLGFLELVYKLESVLQDTVYWVKKNLLDFNAGKTELVAFYSSSNCGSMDVKIYRSHHDDTSYYNKCITSRTCMSDDATFREIPLPSSGIVNNYVAHI